MRAYCGKCNEFMKKTGEWREISLPPENFITWDWFKCPNCKMKVRMCKK